MITVLAFTTVVRTIAHVCRATLVVDDSALDSVVCW